MLIKLFVCGKKPIAESIEAEFVIASELKTEKGILCGTFVIKSAGKTVPVISGRGGFFDAFTLVFGDSEAGEVMAIATYALFNIVFIIYDIALTRLITLYFRKIRVKFKGLK